MRRILHSRVNEPTLRLAAILLIALLLPVGEGYRAKVMLC